jgi:nitroimidazol reductase NimA-like FMN-containing flavoprotein (pyridoxamine 5'-phosphate oxidase superfamily)
MIGTLTESQITQVIYRQLYGRLACQADDRLYIVPVSYAFDGKNIYAHSRDGQKIQMLRKNPRLCFQIDIIDDLSNWLSIIIWGKYHELKTAKEQDLAMKLLDDRFAPLSVSQSISRPTAGINPPESVEKRKKAIYFRISIDEATGRFEKNK